MTSPFAPVDRVDILVVDDKPDKLLALTAVLEELGENVVAASSGRDALRHLLRQPFAVILLDINMPGMDGFEIAQLVRSYRPSRRTPIIFLTAAGDDALLVRSYALGGVDYMLTPVVPDVLRGKVRVFADLHRKTAEVERQTAALTEQAAQLKRLAGASISVAAARSIPAIAQAVADAARHVIDARQALLTLTVTPPTTEGAASFSDAHAAHRDLRPGRAAEALYLLARPAGGPARLTQEEIERDPELYAAQKDAGPARGGLLAAPLTESDGRWIGLLQVSEKRAGDFTEEDEAALVQLAQLGSVAVQNCLKADAREANRLKDEFLATLSHELRAPLHAMLGWTRMLRTGGSDPARLARGLEVIERNVQLQTSLIDELLDVSRIAAGKLRIEGRPVLLAPIVEAAVDTLRPTADQKGVHLHLLVGVDGGRVHGDTARLHQVFSNLIGNAIKFTPRGGRVDVAVIRRGSAIEVEIIDDGVGIRSEFLPFVFDRFRQADSSITRAQGGLGLGLAVVHHLVELHGGSVRAESAGQDQGASFIVRLPELGSAEAPDTARAHAPGAPPYAAAPPGPSAEPPAGAAPGSQRQPVSAVIGAEPAARDTLPSSRALAIEAPRSGGSGEAEATPVSGVHTLDGLKVLVVDDDTDARELLREVLQQRRAHVITASSAREALAAFDAHSPHVLVSDIGMKGEDGYELIRRVRVRAPQDGGRVPALALTAYARTEDRARALAAGFQMHATKPIEPTQLIAAIATLASDTRAKPS